MYMWGYLQYALVGIERLLNSLALMGGRLAVTLDTRGKRILDAGGTRVTLRRKTGSGALSTNEKQRDRRPLTPTTTRNSLRIGIVVRAAGVF